MRRWFRFFVLVCVAIALAILGSRFYVRWVPPEAGAGQSGAEDAAFARAAEPFAGRVVWSSTRTGDHEIHLLELAGGKAELRRLTRDPHVDTFPRFSPDGSRILFNRSRRPWVSFRDPEPWDVWIMNRDGSGERRVAERGYHASFTPNGRFAVFARDEKVVRVAIDGGAENVLIDAGKSVGGWLQEPDLAGKKLAGTVRGGRRSFGIFDFAGGSFLAFPGAGCQIAWWPGRERLVWVDGDEGRGGNRFVTGSADGTRIEPLLDLPGAHSHEYFPRVSRDGEWLVFGASKGGHEHDRADYEIFLWRVGTPATEAKRLTHHSGNDQWPDVFPVSDAAS